MKLLVEPYLNVNASEEQDCEGFHLLCHCVIATICRTFFPTQIEILTQQCIQDIVRVTLKWVAFFLANNSVIIVSATMKLDQNLERLTP